MIGHFHGAMRNTDKNAEEGKCEVSEDEPDECDNADNILLNEYSTLWDDKVDIIMIH